MIGKRFFICWMILVTTFLIQQPVESIALSKSAENTADQIADICIEEWENYGILPSVAVGQAFVESTLGVGTNLFGVNGCGGYGTVSATYAYLRCLHNQYFRGEAAFIFDREDQLAEIMEGGMYCAGEYPYGRYYYNVIQSIDRYGWDSYDEKLSRKLAERSRERERKKSKRLRKERQGHPFRMVFSDEIPVGFCIVDPAYIKKGSTIIWPGGIVEATDTDKSLDNTIIVGCEGIIFPTAMDRFNIFDFSKLEFKIDVFEDVKG